MLRWEHYKLVVNPESVNEFYDLALDPDELTNAYRLPEYEAVRNRMVRRLYDLLRERGDNFYHWMTSTCPIGEVSYDPSMSGLDEESYEGTPA
jgi:hypothetical protein